MKETNIQGLVSFLEDIEDRVDDMKPVMHTIGEKIVSKTMESFKKQRDPISGTPWSPVSSTTTLSQIGGKKFSKTKKGKQKVRDKKILQDQGMRGGLMGSIDQVSTKDSTTITAAKEYAATHQFGDSSRNIKQRRYMPFDDDLDLDKKLADEIIEDISDYVIKD